MTPTPRTQARRAALQMAALLLALAAGGSRAQGPPPPPPEDEALADPAVATPELRAALRDYYVRTLTADLRLSDAEGAALQPKIDALLDAQRDAARSRILAGLDLRRASFAELSATGAEREAAAAAVAAAERAERQGIERVAAARSAILGSLAPRQAARFMAFESRFQDRVRRLAGGPGADGPGGPGPDEGPMGDPPRGGPPASARGARPSGPGPAGGPERDDMRRTALLVFTHDLRQRLELSDAETLTLLPRVEALFEARLTGERMRRELHHRLVTSSDDAATDDATLKQLVAEAVRVEESAPRRVLEAREAVTSSLGPVQAARFLLMEHAAERELRQLVRRARLGWAGASDGSPAGPRRPLGGPGDGAGGGPRPGRPRDGGPPRGGQRPWAPRR